MIKKERNSRKQIVVLDGLNFCLLRRRFSLKWINCQHSDNRFFSQNSWAISWNVMQLTADNLKWYPIFFTFTRSYPFFVDFAVHTVRKLGPHFFLQKCDQVDQHRRFVNLIRYIRRIAAKCFQNGGCHLNIFFAFRSALC